VHGVRARLTVTLVALVALTAGLLALGAYVFVDSRLHDQTRDDAANQARFDLTVLIPRSGLPADPTADDIVASGVLGTLHQRGIETIVATGGTELARSSTELEGTLATLPPDLTSRVANGELAYAWTDVAGEPSLVVGGRLEPGGPDFYFVHDATELERALNQLRIAFAAGFVAAVLVALVVARSVARGVLAPVEAAGQAAHRIAQGDLTARVPVASDDEFGQWARRFNEMADIQAGTIGRLEAAEAQNRRFVADVAHELRTPLAALVAEASILREHLDGLPADSRRAAELLVSDVARLRGLVEDLMEISRFDARAEQVETRPVDMAALVRSVAAARLPGAAVVVPETPVIIESDVRRLERILGNLLDNAREHAAGAPVEVTLTARGPDLVVAVADRGPGVPPDRLAHIFERFYKVDPSRHGGSSGLGLAIAGEHAALLGGTLTAEPREGGGLRMALRLPVTRSLPAGDLFAMGEADG
jgi:two-component system sensor histidine kinase MtrB